MRKRAVLRGRGGLFPALAVLFLAEVNLEATTLVYLPFEKQCSEAKVIVVARAVKQISAWDETRSRIYTDTDFSVEEAVKGGISGSLTVRYLGGTVGELAQSVAGSPSFTVGSKYVLFLEPGSGGRYRVVGFSQGCYQVLSESGGKATVKPQLASAEGVRILGGGKAKAVGLLTLREFLAQVRAQLDRDNKK